MENLIRCVKNQTLRVPLILTRYHITLFLQIVS